MRKRNVEILLDVYKRQILSIMKEVKPNQKETIKIQKEKISKYFRKGTTDKKIEDTIIKALELYQKRQKQMER